MAKYYTNGGDAWKELNPLQCLAVTICYGNIMQPQIRVCNTDVFKYRNIAVRKEITEQEFMKHFDNALNYYIGLATKKVHNTN